MHVTWTFKMEFSIKLCTLIQRYINVPIYENVYANIKATLSNIQNTLSKNIQKKRYLIFKIHLNIHYVNIAKPSFF